VVEGCIVVVRLRVVVHGSVHCKQGSSSSSSSKSSQASSVCVADRQAVFLLGSPTAQNVSDMPVMSMLRSCTHGFVQEAVLPAGCALMQTVAN
jgi:hypothetical protein